MKSSAQTTIGSVIHICKGRKHTLATTPSQNAKRLLNIEDLRNDEKLCYTEDARGTEVTTDDILIAWDGANAGTIGYGKKGYIGSTIARLRIKNNVEVFPPFLGLYLRSNFAYLRQTTTGATIPHISRAALEGLSLPNINFDDQRRIAFLLETVDGLILERKKHLQQMDILLQSIFKEMFGDPVRNEKGWKKGTIRDIVKSIQYGTSCPATPDGEYIYLRMNNITYEGNLNLESIKYINVPDKDFDKYSVSYGDILFNRTNSKELVGKTCVFKCDTPMIIAGYIIRIRTKKNATPDYLSAILNSNYGKKTLRGMCKAIVGQANINAQEVQKIPILLPPIDLQNKFTTIVNKVEGIKAMYQKSLIELENLYGVLSQKAFRGDLDLTRVPLPVTTLTSIDNAQTQEVAEISQCTVEDFVKFGYSAAQFVHKLAEVIAPLLAPLLIALNAAGRGYRQGVEEFHATSTTSKTISSKSIHATKKKLSGGEAQQDIWDILNRFIFEELGDAPFSAQEFVDAVRQELGDITDDQKSSQELSILLYEQVKLWIFDSIKNNKLEQFFNTQENTVSFRRVGGQ